MGHKYCARLLAYRSRAAKSRPHISRLSWPAGVRAIHVVRHNCNNGSCVTWAARSCGP
jgi:hypothetical protein